MFLAEMLHDASRGRALGAPGGPMLIHATGGGLSGIGWVGEYCSPGTSPGALQVVLPSRPLPSADWPPALRRRPRRDEWVD